MTEDMHKIVKRFERKYRGKLPEKFQDWLPPAYDLEHTLYFSENCRTSREMYEQCQYLLNDMTKEGVYPNRLDDLILFRDGFELCSVLDNEIE
jgi:hypothetical protein